MCLQRFVLAFKSLAITFKKVFTWSQVLTWPINSQTNSTFYFFRLILLILFTITTFELFSSVKANSELRTFKQSNIQEVNSLEEIPGSKNYFTYGKYKTFSLKSKQENQKKTFNISAKKGKEDKTWFDGRDHKNTYCVRPGKCEPLKKNVTCMGSLLPKGYVSTSIDLTDSYSLEQTLERLNMFQALRHIPKCWAVIQVSFTNYLKFLILIPLAYTAIHLCCISTKM